MSDIDVYGIGKVMDMANDFLLGAGDRPIHLSFDIDAVDPTVAPSTGTPVRGGLTYREAHHECEAISDTGMLGSMDMVEVNPKLAGRVAGSATAEVAVSLIASAMGARIF